MANQLPARPMEIRRLTAADVPIKLLVYGTPGAGKTTLVSQVLDHPALSPALWLDFEGGLLSVAGRGDIDAVAIQTIQELETAYWKIAMKEGPWGQYKTIIIDSASEIYTKALSEAVEKRVHKSGGSMDFVDRGDYGTASFQTHRIFRMFRDLPGVNVIATAHARFEFPANSDARSSQPTEVVPAFPAKLSSQMQGIFDFVWFLYKFDHAVSELEPPTTHRAIFTTDQGPYRAKTRGRNFPGALGRTVVDPHIPAIYDLLQQTDGGMAVSDTAPQPMLAQPDIQAPVPDVPDEISPEAEQYNGSLPQHPVARINPMLPNAMQLAQEAAQAGYQVEWSVPQTVEEVAAANQPWDQYGTPDNLQPGQDGPTYGLSAELGFEPTLEVPPLFAENPDRPIDAVQHFINAENADQPTQAAMQEAPIGWPSFDDEPEAVTETPAPAQLSSPFDQQPYDYN